MSLADDLVKEVHTIFTSPWTTRDSEKVPEDEDQKLGNDGRRIDAAVLYADLADSTELVSRYKDEFAAEIFKAYLISACRIIRSNDGVITAFDGDRVMGVFVGGWKNTNAARTALQI